MYKKYIFIYVRLYIITHNKYTHIYLYIFRGGSSALHFIKRPLHVQAICANRVFAQTF